VPIKEFEKAQRLINQLDPVIAAAEKLQAAYDAGIKEPSGHPNMHPVRAAMKELEAALGIAVGDIAHHRRKDRLERKHRQSRSRK
jgi:hypothetical protein